MLRVRVVWTSPVGGPYLSTHYFVPPVDDSASAAAAATAVGDFWNAVDINVFSGASWAVQASVDVLDPSTGTLIDTFAVTSPPAGSGGGTDTSSAVAQGLIRWVTDTVINGRRLRGRTFVPMVAEAAANAGVLTAATISTWLAAANALAGQNLAVWHRPTAPAGTDGFAASVESAAVWSQLAYLSSRRD